MRVVAAIQEGRACRRRQIVLVDVVQHAEPRIVRRVVLHVVADAIVVADREHDRCAREGGAQERRRDVERRDRVVVSRELVRRRVSRAIRALGEPSTTDNDRSR